MNKRQEPRLRFKGFTGEWETEGFESVGEFNPKAEIPQIFQYVDLESVVGTQLISYREEFKETAPSRAQRLAKNRDLFFQAVRPYQKNNYLFEKNNENFVFSTGYIQIRPQNDGYFLLTLVQKEEFVQEVLLRCTGTSYPAINTSSLQNIAILIPQTAEEQSTIGNFFRRLDSQIAESRAVLEKSRQLKKAMLAKMFPANGEKIPKIRFKGFEGEWECRKFSEVAELRRGLTYSPLDISQNGIRVLRSSNIDEEYYIEKNDDVFVCERAVNIPLAQNGDILITAANGSSRLVGKHAIIQTSIPAVHGGFMLLARTENPYFLNASMSSAWYLDFIRIFVAGGNGAIGNLSIGDLNEQEILIPKHPEEQTAIGNFFRQLDETIALQSAEVEKLNRLKKGLLAAMLV